MFCVEAQRHPRIAVTTCYHHFTTQEDMMGHAWFSRFVTVVLVGGLCLVGYGLAHAGKPIKPRFSVLPSDPTWVLDRTTSLQWQKTPNNGTITWTNADAYCSSLGGGSRLPDIKELISLVDYSMFQPALPEGNPFQDVFPSWYWSTTAAADNSAWAWLVAIGTGDVAKSEKTASSRTWCVR